MKYLSIFLPFLREYIPHEKAYRILVLCLVLSILLFAFPEKALVSTGLAQTPQLELTIKIVVPLLLILFGLVTSHVLMVHFYSSSANLNYWKFHKKVTLSIGEYYEAKKEDSLIIKITLKEISKQSMPTIFDTMPPSNSCSEVLETATLSFYPYFIYHGKYVKKIETHSSQNEAAFVMSTYQFPEEESSVFFFSIENSSDGERLFRCIVKHINSHKQEVELDIYFLSLNDS